MFSKEKTYKVAVLGCRTNQYEAQGFRDQLQKMGFREATGEEQAALCIVNTCTVTEGADSSSRHEIRKLIKENPEARVVVTGCLAERKPELISSIPGVNLVISNAKKENLLAHLFPEEEDLPEFRIESFEGHTRAFVKVQDGCNSFCTYCIIPYVRGRSRSRSIESVLSEVKNLVENGTKEVVITGINVGDFDGGGSLADLISAVDSVEGIKRVRLSSIDPDEVDDNLLNAILKGKHTCHSMHIVLQSGSNVILKRMNRKYTRQIFLETIERVQKASPDFTFTTDVIWGFPGETESDFEETLSMIREVGFAKVHYFPFSARERTRAFAFPGRVSQEIMQERRKQIMKTSAASAMSVRNRFLGRKMQILTESSEGNLIFGHTDNFLKVACEKGNLEANQLIEVELVENNIDYLIGKR